MYKHGIPSVIAIPQPWLMYQAHFSSDIVSHVTAGELGIDVQITTPTAKGSGKKRLQLATKNLLFPGATTQISLHRCVTLFQLICFSARLCLCVTHGNWKFSLFLRLHAFYVSSFPCAKTCISIAFQPQEKLRWSKQAENNSCPFRIHA